MWQKFSSLGYAYLVLPSQQFELNKNFGNLPRKIYQENGVEYCHEAMIWIVKNAQFFLGILGMTEI